jgi:VWFA-related protein
MLAAFATAAQDLVINVNLRMVDVLVEDENGYPVSDLNTDDFEVLENGHTLPVRHLSLETGPVAVGLVVDRSSSIKPVKANIDRGVSNVLATLRPEDHVFLMTFSGRNKLNVDLTTSHHKILPELRREKLGFGSRFYDVLTDALQRASSCTLQNRVLIVFSDGADHYSRHTFEQVIDHAAFSSVPIYFFGYVGDDSRTWSPDGRRLIREQFDQLAAMTGGKACFTASLTDCAEFARQMSDRTRYRYRLGFYSRETFTEFSEVQVKVRRAGARVSVREMDSATKVPL